MSYKTYTTDAIVCGSRLNNTSDKAFLLFTKEAGIVWATAKSVREERSKQRFSLQDFSLIRVSLVRGKSGWKVGSVDCERNYFLESEAREARLALSSIVRLIRQFVHGEVAHELLFEDTKSAMGLAARGQQTGQDIVDAFTLRLLHKLGYIASYPEFESYLTDSCWYDLPSIPAVAHQAIERAKQVSHL